MISTCDSVALILVSPVLPLRMSVRGYSFARCIALRDRTDCDVFGYHTASLLPPPEAKMSLIIYLHGRVHE